MLCDENALVRVGVLSEVIDEVVLADVEADIGLAIVFVPDGPGSLDVALEVADEKLIAIKNCSDSASIASDSEILESLESETEMPVSLFNPDNQDPPPIEIGLLLS